MRIIKFQLLLLIIFILNNCIIEQNDYMKQWSQFRGPYASGIIDSTNLPDNWDIITGENIRWKIEIPGLGHSSPVIWDNKIFITSAISGSGTDSLKVGIYGEIDDVKDKTIHEFRVFCIDKNTGKILWNKLAHKGIPKTKRHTKSSHANPTPATNGKYIVAFFGSEGLYCYNYDGELIWKKDFGKMSSGYYKSPDVEWGFASSPIVQENRVIIQCDFIGDSFIAAFDVETGEEKWLTKRQEVPTWSTPNYYNQGKNKQIVVNGFKHIGGYDFYTGKEIWKLNGGFDIPVPTPIFAHGLIYIHGAHGKLSPIYAIKPDAKGDITLDSVSSSNEYIKWSIEKGAAYNSTNIIYGEYLYNMSGFRKLLSCFNAQTGKLIYKEKFSETQGISASGIASDGKIYYSTEQGNVYIVKAGKDFEIIAKNSLNDIIMATPAICKDMLIFRTQKYLIAVGK